MTYVQDLPGRVTVYLFGYGGETGRVTNSFVFGNAPQGAVRVRVSPGDEEQWVVDAIYLVPLPMKDLGPADIRWTFLDANGGVLLVGTGIRS